MMSWLFLSSGLGIFQSLEICVTSERHCKKQDWPLETPEVLSTKIKIGYAQL
jgi:hypothetical protein